MPRYVIEREVPGAGKLSAEELKNLSQKSCGVLREMGSQIQWQESFDSDDKSIAEARRLAAQHGVTDRVQFHVNTIEEFNLETPYDLVPAFECLHDLPYPVQVLGRMREMENPGGTVFIADEAAGEGFSDNHNLMGRFCYNVSVLHCLPQAMVFPQAAGTGTAISENTVRTYARKACYSNVSVLELENLFFRFYKLTP